MQLIDKAPRIGAHGHKVAFVHPKATGGVLIELVEPVGHHADRTASALLRRRRGPGQRCGG